MTISNNNSNQITVTETFPYTDYIQVNYTSVIENSSTGVYTNTPIEKKVTPNDSGAVFPDLYSNGNAYGRCILYSIILSTSRTSCTIIYQNYITNASYSFTLTGFVY